MTINKVHDEPEAVLGPDVTTLDNSTWMSEHAESARVNESFLCHSIPLHVRVEMKLVNEEL